jgi:Protein O-mannosyl-transferase TMEM260-like
VTQPSIEHSVRSKAFASAAVVFVVALIVYAGTLAPTVTLVDSGELIVAARFLGVAHPPGFPLYLMLAHLASLVPIGNVAVRVNFASAFFAALAGTMLSLVVAEIIMTSSYVAESEGRSGKAARKKKTFSQSVARAADANWNWLATTASAVGAGLLFAFSRTLWSYATIAEVYTLNTLLILTIFFLMLRWRRQVVAELGSRRGTAKSRRPTGAVTRPDYLLYSAAVIFGLALGVHHVTVALILPALAVLVYKTQGIRFFASKRLLYAALISFAALLAVYSYLPLAAAHRPVLNWGDPRSFRAIWAHVTGRQYQLFLTFSPSIIGQQFLQFGRFLLREFGPPWLPVALVVALAGFVTAWKRDRTVFLWLLFVVLGNLAYNLNYEIAEDKDAYYLPVFVAMAVAAGIGFYSILQFTLARRTSSAGRSLVPVIVALLPALALASNWPFNNRGHYFIAHDYVENIQSTIEPNGLLLTLDWQVASPMLYTREIEQRRPDIKVVDVLLLRRSWYFDYLRRAYPDLIERSRNEVDDYLVDLKHWERDPELYQTSAALTLQINNSFQRMIQSLVTRELQAGPVYVTNELFAVQESQEGDIKRWLNRNFQAVPKGLVFQLFRDRDFHDPGELHLKTRGLTDRTMRFENDDVVKIKVIPSYRAMLENRARYLAHFNEEEGAATARELARRFDPNGPRNPPR